MSDSKRVLKIIVSIVMVLMFFWVGYYFVFASKTPVHEESRDDLFSEENKPKKKIKKPVRNIFSSRESPQKQSSVKADPKTKIEKKQTATPVKTSDKIVDETLKNFEKMPGASFIGPQLKGVVGELYKDFFGELDLGEEEVEALKNHLVNTEKLQIKILQDIMYGKTENKDIVGFN